MWKPSEFRDLVSGRQRGLRATLLRGVLAAAETPYRWAVQLRNAAFDGGLRRVTRVQVPVVSVGNLSLGGTGKTPMVEWLANWFCQHGVHVVLISRGYRAGAGTLNDEALELAKRLPHVPHLQDPHRVRAAQQAIRDYACGLILLDDAFQHRRIARDLDIVLLDALEPFGWSHVFPRGTLREPLTGLARAQVVALSRSDAVDAATRESIRRKVAQLAPDAVWLELVHQPLTLVAADGRQAPLDTLAGRKVAAFCGVGNPAGFRLTVQACGYQLTDFREFPDHFAFADRDVAALEQWTAGLSDISGVVCTNKDLAKINRLRLGPHPLWAVGIGVEIRHGRDGLEARLRALLPG
ncbi:MAG: tetraacyldisaccharide 4'-kinase [Planctomycetota bacterium]|nr:tetraacyldisaccharide 4'-kinase [Planctomycetota bacterium]